MSISMFTDIPATTDPRMNSTNPRRNSGFLPYMSDSFPATGIMMVSQSMYAVTIQE